MGRRPKNWQAKMEQQVNNKLPPVEQGGVIILRLEITKANNGAIIKGLDAQGKESLMVFNGENSHRSAASWVLSLAIADMKEGEVIGFESKMTYTKKIQNNGD